MDTTAMHSLSPELLAANDGWLRALVRRLVDDGQTDDVLQEVWGHAMRTPPRDQKALPAWLATVARRIAGKSTRSSQRRRKHEQAAGQLKADDAVDPSQLVARVEERQRVAQTVLELDEPFRTVVLLRYFEDLTPEQIAARLDIPGATVRSRLHRGHEKLRAQFERERGAGWRGELALLCVPLGQGATLAPAAKLKVTAWLALVPIVIAAFVWWFTNGQGATPAPAPAAKTNAAAATAGAANAPGDAAPMPVDNSNRTANEVVAQPTEARNTSIHLQGICVDPTGKPMAGVTLAFVKHTFLQREVNEQVPVEVGATDLKGRFDLQVPRQQGTLRAAGAFATLRAWEIGGAESSAKDALVVATHRVQLSGIVVKKDGTPAVGSTVAVAIQDTFGLPVAAAGTKLMRFDIKTKTDSTGHFELADVPAFHLGDLRIDFNKALLPIPTIDRHDLRIVFGSGRPKISRAKPAKTNTERATQFTIRGTVVTGDRAVTGAMVRARRTNEVVTTAAAGTFEVQGWAAPNQPAVLWVAAAGYKPRRVEVYREGERAVTPVRVQLHEITANGSPALAGRVVDADNRPVAGMTVMLADATPLEAGSFALQFVESLEPSQLGAHTTTNGAGLFRIPNVLDRPYRVRVLDTETGYARTFGPFDPRRACELRVPNERSSTEHIVRIVDQFNRPVVGANCELAVVQLHTESDSPFSRSWRTTFFGDGKRASSDRNGFCHFTDTPNGDLRITVQKPGWVNAELSLTAGAEQPEHQNGVTTVRMLRLLPLRVATAGLDDRFVKLKLYDATGNELEVKPAWRGNVYPSVHSWGILRGHSVVGAASESACHAELCDLFSNELLRSMPVVFETGRVTVLTFPE